MTYAGWIVAALVVVGGWLLARRRCAARVAGPVDGPGPYRLLAPLGAGGMGQVWRAEHRLLGRPAAVKLVRPEPGASSGSQSARELRLRLEREARVTAQLRSPHTVSLYDYGPTADGGIYYAMELLEGCDLRELVERFGPLEPARVIYLLRQVCDALGEAHAAGLVHRDIKPANLFLTRLGLDHDVVKVLDFGLVVRTGLAADPKITSPGAVVGTPAFMAPEVIDGREADPRADLYALGCVGYWLLTGSDVFPLEGKTPLQVLLEHARETPQSPSRRLGHALPPELEALIMACLEKDPRRRPRSAAELARRLEACPLPRAWTAGDAHRWWAGHLPQLAARAPFREGRGAREETVALWGVPALA